MPWYAWTFLGQVSVIIGLWFWDEKRYQQRKQERRQQEYRRSYAHLLPCPSGDRDCTVDCGRCKGTGFQVTRWR